MVINMFYLVSYYYRYNKTKENSKAIIEASSLQNAISIFNRHSKTEIWKKYGVKFIKITNEQAEKYIDIGDVVYYRM